MDSEIFENVSESIIHLRKFNFIFWNHHKKLRSVMLWGFNHNFTWSGVAVASGFNLFSFPHLLLSDISCYFRLGMKSRENLTAWYFGILSDSSDCHFPDKICTFCYKKFPGMQDLCPLRRIGHRIEMWFRKEMAEIPTTVTFIISHLVLNNYAILMRNFVRASPRI